MSGLLQEGTWYIPLMNWKHYGYTAIFMGMVVSKLFLDDTSVRVSTDSEVSCGASCQALTALSHWP